MKKKLIILGASAFAQVAHAYFTEDSDYEVAAFSVERSYLKKDHFCDLPLVAFESLDQFYPPRSYEIFAAVAYSQMNRLRTRLYLSAKQKGFRPARYISSRAFVWKNVAIGEHCFIFENNTIQPFAALGNNVILWSGNHVGHHARIEDNCFISSQVVISGFVEVGENSFLGVNVAVANNLRIGKDSWIGAGVTLTHHTKEGSLYRAEGVSAEKISALDFQRVPE